MKGVDKEKEEKLEVLENIVKEWRWDFPSIPTRGHFSLHINRRFLKKKRKEFASSLKILALEILIMANIMKVISYFSYSSKFIKSVVKRIVCVWTCPPQLCLNRSAKFQRAARHFSCLHHNEAGQS